MPRDYKLYLRDLIEASERIQEYTKNMSFIDFSVKFPIDGHDPPGHTALAFNRHFQEYGYECD